MIRFPLAVLAFSVILDAEFAQFVFHASDFCPVKSPDSLRDSVFEAAPALIVAEKLFEGMEDAVFCVKNRNREYIAVNRALVRRVGATGKSSLLGRTARELFPPLLAAGYEQQDDLVLKTGQEIHDRLEMVTNPDGSPGWYLAQKVPVHDPHGRVIGLAGISRDLRAPADSDPRLGVIGTIIERIQRDYAESLRIDDLAQSVKMSLSQLERRMQAVLKLSPRQFLTKTRIDAAAAMLRESSAAMGTIATDCGFYDQAMFCRQFRAATGLTPGQYREAKL